MPRRNAALRRLLVVSVCALQLLYAPVSQVQAGADDSEATLSAVQEIVDQSGALGYYVDSTSATVVVVVSDSGESTLEAADLAALLTQFRLESRPITNADIAAILHELGSDGSRPVTKEPYGAYFDPSLGQVVIEASDPPDVFAAVVDKYPGKVIYREGVGGGRDSRSSDASPHKGGAKIVHVPTGTNCTSGFTVKTFGIVRMVTAGHCYANLNMPIVSPGNGSSFGQVVARAPFPARDLELLGGATYIGRIYVGDLTGAVVNVIGAGNPVVGAQGYCVSGSWTAEHCGQTVTSLNGQLCDQAGCTNGLVVYSGGGLTGGGDSGAPFYLPTPNGVLIRGVHIGRINSMYAEKWSRLQDLWGALIVTSS